MGKSEIRPCLRQDLGAVVDLLLDGGAAAPGVTRSQIQDYASAVYFDSPWARDDLPSLVSVAPCGRIDGFVGVVPRRMQVDGEVVDAAVPGNFVVRAGADGTVNSFAATALLRRLFAGPQAITVTDTANEASRRLWEAAGAVNPGLHSLEWFRPVKPATAILQMFELSRRKPPPLAPLVYAGTRAVDLLAAPILARMTRGRAIPFILEPFDEGFALELLNRRDRRTAISGAYEPETLHWLLEMVDAKAEGRILRKAIVADEQGARLGAYIYLLRRDGVAQVLLHTAQEGKIDLVLQALVESARGLGASLVTGPVHPRYLPAYAAQRSFMMCNQWTLVHSRRPDLIDGFQQGRARLTPLDGERWTRFDDLLQI